MKTRELGCDEKMVIFMKRMNGETLMKIAQEHDISPEEVKRIVERIKNNRITRNHEKNKKMEENQDTR